MQWWLLPGWDQAHEVDVQSHSQGRTQWSAVAGGTSIAHLRLRWIDRVKVLQRGLGHRAEMSPGPALGGASGTRLMKVISWAGFHQASWGVCYLLAASSGLWGRAKAPDQDVSC